jgi:hypothetical protein
MASLVNTAAWSYRRRPFWEEHTSWRGTKRATLLISNVFSTSYYVISLRDNVWPWQTLLDGVKIQFADRVPTGSQSLPQASTETKITSNYNSNNSDHNYWGELSECLSLKTARLKRKRLLCVELKQGAIQKIFPWTNFIKWSHNWKAAVCVGRHVSSRTTWTDFGEIWNWESTLKTVGRT